MQAKGPVLVKTEVRKEAQYFGEVTDGGSVAGCQGQLGENSEQ